MRADQPTAGNMQRSEPPKEEQRAFGFRFVAPLAIGSMLNPVNSSMISTALVPIATTFDASVAETGWLIAGLYLASAVAQPTMGRLADIFGPRKVYLVSLVLAAVAGVTGATAPSLAVLIGTRVLLGVGTSGAYPAAMRMFRTRADQLGAPPPRAAMGVLSLAAVATSAIGPFLGGVLTSAFGWNTIFSINVPLALGAIVLILVWTPGDEPRHGGVSRIWNELDLIGIGLFTVFLLSAMLFLMQPGQPQWPALVFAVIFGVLLVVYSLRRSQPFIDIRMLAQNRALTLTYVRVAAILLVGYCVFYGMAQWLESAVGLSAAEAGLVTLPMSFVAAIGSYVGARTKSIRTPFVIATTAALMGCVCLFFLDHNASVWVMAAAVALFGLPLGMTSVATQAAVYIQAPAAAIGTASGLQRTASYLGAIGSAGLLSLAYGHRATDAGLHRLALIMGAISAVLVVAVVLDRTLPRTAEPT